MKSNLNTGDNQMKTAEQTKIKLRKMELDKKYIARKLVEISKNSPIIFSSLRKFKSKCKTKYKYKIFTHEKHLIKLLKINQRTLRLLRDEEYIRHSDLFGFSIYVLSDIYNFLKENNKYQKRNSG
jgi:hypothetical protein